MPGAPKAGSRSFRQVFGGLWSWSEPRLWQSLIAGAVLRLVSITADDLPYPSGHAPALLKTLQRSRFFPQIVKINRSLTAVPPPANTPPVLPRVKDPLIEFAFGNFTRNKNAQRIYYLWVHVIFVPQPVMGVSYTLWGSLVVSRA